MKCKAFDVGIELEIQAVTCPGVWLCPNGQVTVQIYMLGLCSQTSTMNPVFPLLCHEKFTFNKTFSNLNTLFDLDSKMRTELVYMEFIQWEDCDHGNVLATFKTSLSELLYPFPKRKGLLPGVDVDLLMEATSKFPGIIAPKLEISTKMTINEVLCSVKKDKETDVCVINPKLISSKIIPRRKVPLHQKKVCHSHRYHNDKPKKSNYKKNVTDFTNNLLDFDDIDNSSPKTSKRLLIKKVSNVYHNDNSDNIEKDFTVEKVKQLRKYGPEMECRCEEMKLRCPLCEKYKTEFSEPCRCELVENQDLRRNSKNDEIKKLIADVHSENEKRNSLHESVQKNGSFSPIDFDKGRDILLEKASSSPTYFTHDSKNTLYTGGESCTDKFYKNLEQFYKKLYMRAHYKLKNERGKYP